MQLYCGIELHSNNSEKVSLISRVRMQLLASPTPLIEPHLIKYTSTWPRHSGFILIFAPSASLKMLP